MLMLKGIIQIGRRQFRGEGNLTSDLGGDTARSFERMRLLGRKVAEWPLTGKVATYGAHILKNREKREMWAPPRKREIRPRKRVLSISTHLEAALL